MGICNFHVAEMGMGNDKLSYVFFSIVESYIFTIYFFRNFEESEDELRNEVVESLEKLTTSKEEEKREEAFSSSEDAENLGEKD